MPKFNDQTMEEMGGSGVGAGHYGFSGVKIDNLEASEYTLVSIIVDESGSTSGFTPQMEACIQEIVKACRKSPRADYLMLRLVGFANTLEEMHGFKMLEQCQVGDYQGCLGVNQNGYSTALYDSAENAILASQAYAEQLSDQDYDVNGIVFVITDGDDNSSSAGQVEVKNALEKCITSEKMESLVSVLIGVNVNQPQLAQYLDDFQRDVNFTQYVKLEDADASTLAKLADFVSKSISSQSQALGSGGPSQSLVF